VIGIFAAMKICRVIFLNPATRRSVDKFTIRPPYRAHSLFQI
jgi:hypothetical protein